MSNEVGQQRIVIDTAPPTRAPQPVYGKAPPAPRRAGKIALVAIGVLMVVAAATVGVMMTRDGEQPGSNSPEDAVNRLTAAVNNEDMLGVFEALAPSERETWVEPFRRLLTESERLNVVPPEVDLQQIGGLDLDVQVAQGEPQEVATGVVIIPVGGSVSAAVDWAGFPLGPVLVERGIGSNKAADGKVKVTGRIAAVQVEDRWYVSIAYSLAEALRRQLRPGLAWPSPGEAVQPHGARTPEDAVVEFLDAAGGLKLREMIARLDPQEAGVLQRIAPWFVDDAQAAIDGYIGSPGLAVKELTLTPRVIEADDDRALVAADDLSLQLQVGTARVQLAEGCVTTSATGASPVPACWHTPLSSDTPAVTVFERNGMDDLVPPVSEMLPDLQAALQDMGEQGIPVRRVRGAWYVSPLTFLWEYLLGAVAALDRDELDTLISDGLAVFRAAQVMVGGSVVPEKPEVTAAPTTAAPTVDAYLDCQGKNTYADALLCVQNGLRAGAFPRDVVDGIYLAPQCGWVGSRFDVGLRELSDSDYATAATLASFCFDDKIASGILTESQRPFELVKPSCLNGKNPFNMSVREAQAYSDCRIAEE